MKATSALILCLLGFALAGCGAKPVRQAAPPPAPRAAVQPGRAASPAFKGMELYSWKPSGDWRFSLLPGTNRNKWLAEITDPKNTIIGVKNLKKKLATLAVGENVFWSNSIVVDKPERAAWAKLAKEKVPPDMVRDLTLYCRGLRIRLVGP